MWICLEVGHAEMRVRVSGEDVRAHPIDGCASAAIEHLGRVEKYPAAQRVSKHGQPQRLAVIRLAETPQAAGQLKGDWVRCGLRGLIVMALARIEDQQRQQHQK